MAKTFDSVLNEAISVCRGRAGACNKKCNYIDNRGREVK